MKAIPFIVTLSLLLCHCASPWEGPCSSLAPRMVKESPYSTKQVKDGPQYSCYKDTARWRSVAFYCMGKPCGVDMAWAEGGTLLKENHHCNGQLCGLSKAWHRNGQLWHERHYKDGKRCGVCREWDENGTLLKEERHPPC